MLTSQCNVDVWYDETDEMMDYWIDWEGMVREEDRKGEGRKEGREFWRLLDRPFRMLTSQCNVDVWYDETDEMMDYWIDWEGMVREEDRKGEGRKEGREFWRLLDRPFRMLTSQCNVDVWYDETDEMMDYWIDWEGMVREEDRKGEGRKEGREFWRLLDRPFIFEF